MIVNNTLPSGKDYFIECLFLFLFQGWVLIRRVNLREPIKARPCFLKKAYLYNKNEKDKPDFRNVICDAGITGTICRNGIA